NASSYNALLMWGHINGVTAVIVSSQSHLGIFKV
ncbi:MAG: hypothetical protein JWQ30_701, partial [Sediminibacterium sp.]|nr:hypothetical protein [Sediminibacterium sp.]